MEFKAIWVNGIAQQEAEHQGLVRAHLREVGDLTVFFISSILVLHLLPSHLPYPAHAYSHSGSKHLARNP